MSEELTAIDPAELEADLAEVMAAGGEPHHKEMVAKFARLANQALLERDASRAREKALVEALRAMLDDYRSEGCPDPKCRVCHRSNVAEAKARALIAPYSTPSPEAPSDVHPQGE